MSVARGQFNGQYSDVVVANDRSQAKNTMTVAYTLIHSER